MARYLLIEFDNDAQANAMMDKVDAQTLAGKAYRVVGVFQKPTKICDCPEMKNAADWYQQDHTTRGAKYGWWVHIDCRRARNHQIGRNLMDPPDTPSKDVSAFLSLHMQPNRNYPLTTKPWNPDPFRDVSTAHVSR